MKSLIVLTIIALLLVYLSCKQKTNIVTEPNHDWTTIIINEEDDRIITYINNQDDTSLIKFNDFGSFFTGYHKTKTDSVKSYFTMAEKDTIFNLARGIISTAVKPKVRCTDFVGDIEITIYYYENFGEPGSYKQMIAYSGICRWDTLSFKTAQLQAILHRKIKTCAHL